MNSFRSRSLENGNIQWAILRGIELVVPGGIVVVTAIATETGGDGGVDDTVFCREIETEKIPISQHANSKLQTFMVSKAQND